MIDSRTVTRMYPALAAALRPSRRSRSSRAEAPQESARSRPPPPSQQRSGSGSAGSAAPAKSPYRSSALRARSQARVEGDVLRLSPEWLPWAYVVVMVTFAGALAFAAITHVHDWANGPAVVRIAGRTDLTVPAAGLVKSIAIGAGQHVEAGQLLVEFASAPEQHELERAATEFDAALVKVLRDPADEPTRKELARARAARSFAEAQVHERALKAPRAGTIREVRIRVGQSIAPGEIVLTLVEDDTRPTVVALLPAYAHPQLKPGMTLRFSPSRFDFVHQDLVIQSVSDEVLGPSEIRRYLGPELADAVRLEEPSVIVTALVPADGFRCNGRLYRFTQGLPGEARAQLRTHSLLMMLLPEIRNFMEQKNAAP
jgi:membrane fusion protein (multidrug efflux system)